MLTIVIDKCQVLQLYTVIIYCHSCHSPGGVLVVRWLLHKRHQDLDCPLFNSTPLDPLLIQLAYGERKKTIKRLCQRFLCLILKQNAHIFLARTQSYSQNCLQDKYSPTMYSGIKGKLKLEKPPRKNMGFQQGYQRG